MKELNIEFIDECNLLEYLKDLKEDEIININESTTGTFLKSKNIIIIEDANGVPSAFYSYDWNEYIEKIKKEMENNDN